MATTQRTVITNKTLCQAFLITSLLTRDATQSESAILSAIASSDPEGVSEHEFILRSAAIALAAQPPARLRAPLRVPAGLSNVLRLSQSNRHCFVLRTLAGMSRDECSRILNIEVPRVDENTALAAMELSELAFREDFQDVDTSSGATWNSNGLNPLPSYPHWAAPELSELNNHG
jgi:hypothetical protein